MAGRSGFSSGRCARRTAERAERAMARPSGGLVRRRAHLEARWRETLERVTTLSVAYHDAAARQSAGPLTAPTGRARAALDTREDGQDISRLARRVVTERQALAEIEAALDRIATGHYGRCEQCYRPISAGLLAAQPTARFCSTCSRRSAHLVVYA